MCFSRQSAPQIQYVYVPQPPTPTPAPSKDPWAGGAPNSGNQIQAETRLPNNGLGTIESVRPTPASTNAPTLADPTGEGSQRVQRQKAKLAIAQ